MTDAACWSCGTVRPLAELLVIRDRQADRPAWYCCRPSVAEGDCLRRAAGPAVRYSVALAVPDAPDAAHDPPSPLVVDPAPDYVIASRLMQSRDACVNAQHPDRWWSGVGVGYHRSIGTSLPTGPSLFDCIRGVSR